MRTRGALLAALAAVATTATCTASAAVRLDPRIEVVPARALVDQAVDIRVTGLRPDERVTLIASTRDAHGVLWRSSEHVVASERGVADTHGDMRLFWSMQAVPPRPDLPFSETVRPLPISITAAVRGRAVATATFERTERTADLAIRDTSLAGQGFVGTWYARPGGRSRTAVLWLGGALPGHEAWPAELFADHGFPSLSLAYFGVRGLPPTLRNIPLEYFERALRWIAARPGVDPRRVVVAAVSRGAEAALLLAADFPDLVGGVVACTPPGQILGADPGPGVAWTLGGKPVGGTRVGFPIEKITAPVWLTGGALDAVIPSAVDVRDILAAARADHRGNIRGTIYAHAGHGVGCTAPNVPLTAEFRVAPATYAEMGGTPTADEEAAAAAWPRLMRFLRMLEP